MHIMPAIFHHPLRNRFATNSVRFLRPISVAAALGLLGVLFSGTRNEAFAQAVCSLGTATGLHSTACGQGAIAGYAETSIGADAGSAVAFAYPPTGPNDGSTNVGTGAGAGSTGQSNTAMGLRAGQNTTGNLNVAI